MNTVIMTLARQAAIKAVKRRLQAQGLKPQHIPAKEIRALAEEYLQQHRARLMAEAAELIATSPAFERWRCATLESFDKRRRR
jgi:uroporphyrinogen-III synthase